MAWYPRTDEEAFEAFSDRHDEPDDCHQHCKHFDQGEDCCDCGEAHEQVHEAIPVKEFFQQQETESEDAYLLGMPPTFE